MAQGAPEPAPAADKEAGRRTEAALSSRQGELEAENAALRAALADQQAVLDQLRTRHDMFEVMLDTVPMGLAYGDIEYTLAHVNRAMARWWGYSKEETVGRKAGDVMLPGGFAVALPYMQKAIANRQTISHERTAVGRDGQVHVLRQLYSPHIDQSGAVLGIAGVLFDVTEEKRAEEALQEGLRRGAVAEERNRLARELHDAATQTIYSAMLIAEALPQTFARDPAEGRRNLAKLRQLVRGALAEMRTLLLELRPLALETVAFDRILEYLRDSLVGRARLDLEWNVQPAGQMQAATKIAIYRIAQEALNNIVKHAMASLVRVTLRCENGDCLLIIEDDGRGFEAENVAGDHMGLQIMRERAQEIGGSLCISSRPGSGTTIKLTWSATFAEESADEQSVR